MGLALSTAWNAFRARTAADIVSEITKLGFHEVELSFNLTTSIVEDFLNLVRKGSVQVTSLHNFCPIPDGLSREAALPDVYSMASCIEEERLQALQFTKRTIETAQRLGAQAVVLHCGRVEIPERTRELIDMLVRGKKDNSEYRTLQAQIIAQRRELCTPFFENTLKSLRELEAFARQKGIKLGVETRYYYREIPSFEEIGIIVKEFKGSSLLYWHDAGHAQFMENLGFAAHRDFLDAYAHSMLGIHLHDITGYHDHKAPLQGNLDFSLLAPYLKKETIKVLEAHFPSTGNQIKKGKKFLEKTFHGKI